MRLVIADIVCPHGWWVGGPTNRDGLGDEGNGGRWHGKDLNAQPTVRSGSWQAFGKP